MPHPIQFDEIEPGLALLDMHYGLGVQPFGLDRPVQVTSHIRTCSGVGTRFIEETVQEARGGKGYRYLNKILVVLHAEYVTTFEGRIVAAYSYDGMWFGMIELSVDLR